MAYTAAALSYLVQGSPKPIVLTGAQKPIWFDGTDSKRNLTDAFLYACRGCGGVQIVFNGKVILGTRARKTCSKSFHAFSSVNYPDLAVVQDGHLLQYMRCACYPRPLFYDTLDTRVGLLKLIPGTSSELIDFMLDRHDGLIIESFGVGGLPEYEDADFYDAVCRGVEQGKIVVMTTQVPNEGSDLTVYHVGGRLKSTLRLLEAYDMTTESAVAKLMWILGQTRDFGEAERLFYRPVARDILYEN
jgi:L-asparaginase